MASHFPSIEELDPTLDTTTGSGEGEDLDFLKREQEALGDLFDTTDSSAFPDLLNSDNAANAATTEFERSFPALDDDQVWAPSKHTLKRVRIYSLTWK